MDARDPVEAVEILDLLLKFFGEGERWIKGRFGDRRGNCCLVGALDVVSSHHAARGEAAQRYLADAFPMRGTGAPVAIRMARTMSSCGRWYQASEAVLRRTAFPILTMAVRTSPSCGPLSSRPARER
jgi:hypothetical protein